MTLFRPLPRLITRPFDRHRSAWVRRWRCSSTGRTSRPRRALPQTLRDLAHAEWRGVYYRGDKIGFTVSQTLPRATASTAGVTAASDVAPWSRKLPRHSHSARVDQHFALRSFDFSLDPGTGAVVVRGSRGADRRFASRAPHHRHHVRRKNAHGNARARGRSRPLAEFFASPGRGSSWPLTSAVGDLRPGHAAQRAGHVEIGQREVVRNTGERPMPASGWRWNTGTPTTSWITDTGDVVRKESPLGLITAASRPTAPSRWPCRTRADDLLQAAAVVPAMHSASTSRAMSACCASSSMALT